MILALLGMLVMVPDATPKTFQELELAKIAAIHDIRTFHLTMNAVLTAGTAGKSSTMNIDLVADGPKRHLKMGVPGTYTMELVDTGSRMVIVTDPAKSYWEEKELPTDVFDPKTALIVAPEKAFAYRFSPDSQFSFSSDPPFEMGPIEDDKQNGVALRKVVSTAKSADGRTITLTEWFLPDKWILTMFTIAGQGTDGPFSVKAECPSMNLKASIDPKEFVIDAGMTKDYNLQEFRIFDASESPAAFAYFHKKADGGNAKAMLILGQLYYGGFGVEKNEATGFGWVKKSADLGNAEAMSGLGGLYSRGKGVTEDDAEGFKWYKKAADTGNANGMDGVAAGYFNGRGVTKDVAEAIKWYIKSGDAGFASAYFSLGYLYANGTGVPKDEQAGLKYLKLGADHNDLQSIFSMGQLYETGQIVGMDRERAMAFYRKAAQMGSEDGKAALQRLEAAP